MPAVSNTSNTYWNLETFLDSMIVELDKARDTLALKAINKPLTYAVKDIALDLQLFPSFDGDKVKFITAQPGQAGASRVSIQLGSITDQQVRETSRLPTANDVTIDSIEGLDEDTKKNLKKIGVNSVKDVEKIEKKNVALDKTGAVNTNYRNLTAMIEKARRAKIPPAVSKISVSKSIDGPVLELTGKNLSVARKYKPVVVINDQLAEVLQHKADKLVIQMSAGQLKKDVNEVVVTLDPFAIFRMNIHAKKIAT
jgi:hypothetical protein